jgi:hypothetical protein
LAAAQPQLGDGVAIVSIDVDPNETAQALARHATNNNLDWAFAIAPPDMQRALAAAFGRNVLNPPAGNLILVDRAGNARLLRPGVKPADEIVRTVADAQ